MIAPGRTDAERVKAAMDFFVRAGWTVQQAAGIVGNLWAESTVRHDLRQHGNGPGFGLAQWEGPRQAAFKSWAGVPIQESTFDMQLHFIQHELTGPESKAGRALRACLTAKDAGAVVCLQYERPADQARQAPYRAGVADRFAREYVPNFDNVAGGVASTAPAP